MSIWLEPRTLLIGLIVLGMAFTEGSANDWLAIGMVDDRGVDNGQGAVLFGDLHDRDDGRTDRRRSRCSTGSAACAVLRGAAVVAAIGLAIVIFVPIIPIAIVGVVLWGLGRVARLPGRRCRRPPTTRCARRLG